MNLDTIRKACEFSARRNKQLNDLELASIHANVDLPEAVYKELNKTSVQMRRLRRGYELRLKAATVTGKIFRFSFSIVFKCNDLVKENKYKYT